jgi:hypothetical protein
MQFKYLGGEFSKGRGQVRHRNKYAKNDTIPSTFTSANILPTRQQSRVLTQINLKRRHPFWQPIERSLKVISEGG